MEHGQGFVRRSLHRAIDHAVQRAEAWGAIAHDLVDLHPSALLGLGVGLVKLAIANARGTAAPASSRAPGE